LSGKNPIPASERLICFLLILALFVIVFLVLIKPAFLISQVKQIEFRKVSYTLPADAKLVIDWQSYSADRIYEKIDGRVTLFKEYGVERLDFASVRIGKYNFDVYVYVMNSPDSALGVYLAEQPEDSTPIDIATIADFTKTLVRVCKGKIYLTIVTLEKKSDIRTAISLARTLSESFPQPRAASKMLSLLPKRGRVKATLSWNKEETFGLQSLKATLSAEYKIAGLRFTYFVKQLSGTDKNIMQKISSELKEFEANKLRVTEKGISADLFGKHLLIIHRQKYLVGVYGRMRPKQARKILYEFTE